jgi:hypothetical protein
LFFLFSAFRFTLLLKLTAASLSIVKTKSSNYSSLQCTLWHFLHLMSSLCCPLFSTLNITFFRVFIIHPHLLSKFFSIYLSSSMLVSYLGCWSMRAYWSDSSMFVMHVILFGAQISARLFYYHYYWVR